MESAEETAIPTSDDDKPWTMEYWCMNFDKVKDYLGASYQKSINLTMVELIARDQTIKHITLLWVLFLIH